MKKILIGLFAIIIAIACKNSETTSNETNTPEEKVYELSEFMKIANDSLNKEVHVKGTVSHICSHSGRRCFLVDSTADISVKVEATGNISGFNRELSGMEVVVTGIVREKRLYNDYLDEWETKVLSQEKDLEEGGEHCASEMQNIKDMRKWMAENNKDYYQIIYLDGTDYNILYEDKE